MLKINSSGEKMSVNRKTIASIASVFCGSLAMLTPSARAGLIIAGPYVATGTAGNATATVISLPPTFDITSAAKSFTSIGPLDFQFPVTPSGGSVTYLVTEGVTNNTSLTWTDYHEQLGTGTDGSFVLGSPVDFVLPVDATYTNPAFPSRSVTTSEIGYTGGAVAPGQAISMTFSINVPDISVAGGPANFTLRQFPTVPEPGSLSLLALGSIRFLARRHRR
jgi:hypothetical protein